jgi:hypothetical protein
MLDFSIDIRTLMRNHPEESANLLFTRDDHLQWTGIQGQQEFHPILETWSTRIFRNLSNDGSLLYNHLIIVNDGMDPVKELICKDRREKENATFLNQWRKIRNPRCKKTWKRECGMHLFLNLYLYIYI